MLGSYRNSKTIRHRPNPIVALVGVAALVAGTGTRADEAADRPEEPVAARYVTLTSPIDDQLISWVREVGLDLQKEAGQTGRARSSCWRSLRERASSITSMASPTSSRRLPCRA